MKTIQQEIIKVESVSATIDPKQEIRRSIVLLKEYLQQHSFLKTLVLGISGGQDSSLAGRLAQLAIEELRQETGDEGYQFIAVRLPYGEQADEVDALQALEFIQPDQTMRVDIKPAVDATVNEMEHNGVIIGDFNKGNLKARQRMATQYAIAGATDGVVVGTDHSAENVTGFFTKYGDGGADILPLFRLNKRQGKLLLQELNAPESLYEKVPTADLEDQKPLLADEDALGVTYAEIDDYLEGKKISEESAAKIVQWYTRTEHKRHLPITVFDDFWKK